MLGETNDFFLSSPVAKETKNRTGFNFTALAVKKLLHKSPKP
jgi:hypothetical protein